MPVFRILIQAIRRKDNSFISPPSFSENEAKNASQFRVRAVVVSTPRPSESSTLTEYGTQSSVRFNRDQINKKSGQLSPVLSLHVVVPPRNFLFLQSANPTKLHTDRGKKHLLSDGLGNTRFVSITSRSPARLWGDVRSAGHKFVASQCSPGLEVRVSCRT